MPNGGQTQPHGHWQGKDPQHGKGKGPQQGKGPQHGKGYGLAQGKGPQQGEGHGPQQGKGHGPHQSKGPQQGKGHGPAQGKGPEEGKGKGQAHPQGKGHGPPQGKGQAPPQGTGQGPPQAKDKARTFAETLAHVDYDIDSNPTEGFTTRWADRDAYVHKASLVHTVHEFAAARRWAWEHGAQRDLWFERVEGLKEHKHGDMVKVIEWVAEIEVWSNYELTDGDLIHGWDMKRADVDIVDVAPNPDWIGKVQGDGTSGDMVTIVCANKLPILHIRRWWCCVLPDEAAFRSLREEIRTGEAWNTLLNACRQEPQLSASLPDEDQHILRHLVEHHNLNPFQALAIRQCLDEGALVSSMTGGGRHGEVGEPGGLHQGSDVAAGVLRPMHPESQGARFDTHWQERGGGGHPPTNPLGHASWSPPQQTHRSTT